MAVARCVGDRLARFGSSARDAARADSDVDILVSFNGPDTSGRCCGVQLFLEDLLGRPVVLARRFGGDWSWPRETG